MKAQLPFTLKITVLLFFSITTSSYAQNTNVPDDNFENYLETHDADGNVVPLGDPNSMGNGIANDDLVFTDRINTVTTLNVLGQSISDLTGIEDFTALTELNCFDNNLTNLDVSANTALTILDFTLNNLSSIDVSNNTSLTNLICGTNNLTSLDVSANTALTELWCHDNNLTSLDVSNNIALTGLACGGNSLTSLDVSANPNLLELWCSDNNITNLDLSNNTALTTLWCESNNLTSLNVKNGNNMAIEDIYFNTINNPNLTCIQVDDTAWSTANWTNIDPQSYFSEDCALGINNFVQNSISIYPNPAQNFFKINTDLPISEVVIYTIRGKMVSKHKKNKRYDISGLKSGIYFVTVKSNSKTFIQKLLID